MVGIASYNWPTFAFTCYCMLNDSRGMKVRALHPSISFISMLAQIRVAKTVENLCIFTVSSIFKSKQSRNLVAK